MDRKRIDDVTEPAPIPDAALPDFTVTGPSVGSTVPMPPDGGTAPALARSAIGRRDELGMEAQHFLDIRRMGVERLDDGFARKDERLVKGVQMMHDTLAHADRKSKRLKP